MPYYLVAAAIVGGGIFLVLRPRYQILITFILMCGGFNLLPSVVMGWHIWDLGIPLLIIVYIKSLIRNKELSFSMPFYTVILRVFISWMVFCFVWSLLVKGYQVVDVVKVSRELIIGYCTFFVFMRVFTTDREALPFLLKSLYVLTFALLIIVVIQSFIGTKILTGLYRAYGTTTRFLPIFLPICLFYFWLLSARLLSGEKIAVHAYLYILLVLFAVVSTYTRGIYMTFLLISFYMVVILIREGRMRAGSFIAASSALVMVLALALGTGIADRALGRLMSGLSLISQNEATVTNSKETDDTFTGRYMLLGERIQMVAETDPIFGYGFLHEDNISSRFRAKLDYGSVIHTAEYNEKYIWGHPYVLALYSADIGWADIVLKTGLIGLFLLLMFLVIIGGAYFGAIVKRRGLRRSPDYFIRLAFYLQFSTVPILMFNGNPLVVNVQIPMFLLAGFAFYTSCYRKNRQPKLIFEA